MTDKNFPPRGSGVAGRAETPPEQTWGHPWQLGPGWEWRPGHIMLGQWEGRVLGSNDDRHAVTMAGTRAGKSSTVLIPNLRRFPGSAVVLDPKGELARATAEHRRKMGQHVFILDPFGETGMPTASHNPFAELLSGNPDHIAADVAQIADALIIGKAPVPRGELPVWFVLEEFPALGHMRSIETAAGLMAGFSAALRQR